MESVARAVSAREAAHGPVDVVFDRRCTSHMSAGMTLYVRKLAELLPGVAPDLRFAFTGKGDNFDAAEQVGLPLAIMRLRARLSHVPTPFVPVALPRRFVLTIHDLIDLHYPQFGKRKVGPYYRWVVGPVARRACAVITDDRMTVADLRRFLGVDPGRVRIIPLGVDLPVPAMSPASNGRPYFLYVGNRRPHKNVATLVRAWSTLPAALAADLYVTGEPDSALVATATDRPNGELRFLGQRSDAELVEFYRSARAYVHPALREGFGLPILEAMRAGTPVIAATAALPHVLAPHAHGFAATDVGALRDQLVRALLEPQPFAARAVAAQAATRALTWERTARATADVYREFLA
jgi:glycosyltransferase involved in cell wall biosynthesis